MHMPMHYPPMPYPGHYGAPKGAHSSKGSSSSGSDTDEEEEGSDPGKDDNAPMTSSSTVALELSDGDNSTSELASRSLPVAIPLPISMLQMSPADKTVPLVRRGHKLVSNHHTIDPSADFFIAPARSSAELPSVYDIIQQRVANAAKAARTMAVEATGDGNVTP